MMDTKHKVRLHPEYVLRVADLMAPVEIAEDFTLGDLCRIINHFEDIDIETFSTSLHCPLKPLLEECLRPRDTSSLPKSDLHYICLGRAARRACWVNSRGELVFRFGGPSCSHPVSV